MNTLFDTGPVVLEGFVTPGVIPVEEEEKLKREVLKIEVNGNIVLLT